MYILQFPLVPFFVFVDGSGSSTLSSSLHSPSPWSILLLTLTAVGLFGFFLPSLSDWFSSVLLFLYWTPLSNLASPSLFRWCVCVLYQQLICSLISFSTLLLISAWDRIWLCLAAFTVGLVIFMRSYVILMFHLFWVTVIRFIYLVFFLWCFYVF